LLTLWSNTETLKIDFKRAYQAEDLYVLKTFGIEVDWNVFEGCILDTRVDTRDAKHFKVTFVPGSNKAVFQKPIMAAPYHLDLNAYTFEDRWMLNAYLAAKTAAQQAVLNDSKAAYKKITLVFPEGYKLSQRGLAAEVPANEDGTVSAKSNIIVYKKATGKDDSNGNPVIATHTRIVWRFVNMASRTALGLPDDNGEEHDVNGAFAGMP
jgi:hypothetical protein